MLADTDRIRNLLGVYCERLDAGDFSGVGELFADGALADEHGNELARGSEAVASFLQQTVRLHDGSPRTKHLVLDTVFEEPRAGEPATEHSITVRSSYVVLQAVEGFELRPIITGRYVDRFGHNDDGTWHFVERRFAVDLTGDLRHHLAWDLPDS